MRRSGFTTIEILMVIIIIGIIATIGFPRIRDAVRKTNIRSARVALTGLTATSRAAAVQRGCRSVIHFTAGATGKVWVTACPRLKPGAGTVDTMGSVDPLATRFGVILAMTADSIQFDARGLQIGYATTVVRITSTGTSANDSMTVNQIGKVVH